MALLVAFGMSSVAAQEADTATPFARPITPNYASRALGVLPGDELSVGNGVNDAGSVVGYSSGGGGQRAFYWDRQTGVLHQLTTSGMNGVAHAIAGGPGATAYAVGYEGLAPTPHAVIWIAPPMSGPITLDGSPSVAFGVNDNGVAVGGRSNTPAIWSPNGTGGYTRTNIAMLPNHQSAAALDINNDGIVVGVGYVTGTTPRPRAFLRLLNGNVLELPPAQGDSNSYAKAVSDVFTNLGNEFVYVAGWTSGAVNSAAGVRWIVNVGTGVVVDQAVLSLFLATGVNGAGDVAGESSQTHPHDVQSATLWQGGSYITLAPPKGFRGGTAQGLARTASSPTYVVGEAEMQGQMRGATQAVVWDVN
jgi:probable HAF family extracellular repeat protein